jgi:hypothetical protein
MGEPIQPDDFVSRLIHYGWDRAFLFLHRVWLPPLRRNTPRRACQVQTETVPVFAGFDGYNRGRLGTVDPILRASLALKYQSLQTLQRRCHLQPI